MSANHTQLPWRRDRFGSSIHPDREGSRQESAIAVFVSAGTRSEAQAKADAEFVVRVCNSHYDLVRALINARERIEVGGLWTDRLKREIDAAISLAAPLPAAPASPLTADLQQASSVEARTGQQGEGL